MYFLRISIEGKSVWHNKDEECDVIETVKSVVGDAACNSGFSGMSIWLKKRTRNNGEWENSDTEFFLFPLVGNKVDNNKLNGTSSAVASCSTFVNNKNITYFVQWI